MKSKPPLTPTPEKIAVGVRLSPVAFAILEKLQAQQGLSKTAVLETLLRNVAERWKAERRSGGQIDH